MNFKKKLLILSLFLSTLFPSIVFAYSNKIILGGENVGIKVNSKNVMVVGFYKVEDKYVGEDAGLEIGDVITEVNGHKVDIPSYLVKAGDVVSVREIRKDNGTIKVALEENSARPVPAWLEREKDSLSGKVVKLATREDIDLPVEEHLIVELYSK